MKKMTNKAYIEGRVYEHQLQVKQVKNEQSANYGKDFIGGSVDILTDNGLNVVTVFFTYVTEFTAKQKKNDTYASLLKIINEGKTVLVDGMEEATCVKIDTALSVNDFVDKEDKIVAAKRNEGGFVHIIKPSELNVNTADRSRFEVDMFITGTKYVEADEEKNIPADYLILKGACFNFRNELLPVDIVVKQPGGIKYFESLDITNASPVFTKVWGSIACETISREVIEESAWGEPTVKKYERKLREWVVTGTAKEAYDYGDESVLTKTDIEDAMAKREIHLSEVRKRDADYKASRNTPAGGSASSASAGVSAGAGGFNF